MSTFGSATLTLQGPGGKVKYELTGDRTTVGRTRDNEIVLQDPAVSSHHCEFVADKVGLLLRDLNSSNGTYVNGRRVQSGPVYDGDAIKIGQFQGRIAVRKVDGLPFAAPGVSGPGVIVGAIVGAVLIIGLVAFFFIRQKGAADEELLTSYRAKAETFLALEPCKAVEGDLKRLRAITPRDAPEVGKRGKLSRTEKEKDEAILDQSKKREPVLDTIVNQAALVVAQQKAGIAELRTLGTRFNDEALTDETRSLEKLYAERAQAGEEFSEQLKKHQSQVIEFNDHLSKLVERGDRDAAEALDGFRFKGEPVKLLEECRARFGKTQQDGLLKLAGIGP